jgi:hypothetical protein
MAMAHPWRQNLVSGLVAVSYRVSAELCKTLAARRVVDFETRLDSCTAVLPFNYIQINNLWAVISFVTPCPVMTQTDTLHLYVVEVGGPRNGLKSEICDP